MKFHQFTVEENAETKDVIFNLSSIVLVNPIGSAACLVCINDGSEEGRWFKVTKSIDEMAIILGARAD